jgi:DNA-binding transcriptional LysR family regulator
MKLQHLRFLVSVVDCGGVVKAAERLRVSQPAISAALKSLEQELGSPLFESSVRGRSVRPTPRALEFYKDAREILRSCEVAHAKFRQKDAPSAKLRIGVLQTIAGRHVAGFVRALGLGAPGLELQVLEAGPIRLQEWLRTGRIDIAWTSLDRAGKTARVLWQEPFVVLAAPQHRLARGRRRDVSVSDLEGERLILRGSCEMRRGKLWPESLRMRVVARAERDDVALKLVAEGLGIAIAPASLATDQVVALKPKDFGATRSIGLKWRPDLGDAALAPCLEAFKSVKTGGKD